MERDIYSVIEEFEFMGSIEDYLDKQSHFDLDMLEEFDDVLGDKLDG